MYWGYPYTRLLPLSFFITSYGSSYWSTPRYSLYDCYEFFSRYVTIEWYVYRSSLWYLVYGYYSSWIYFFYMVSYLSCTDYTNNRCSKQKSPTSWQSDGLVYYFVISEWFTNICTTLSKPSSFDDYYVYTLNEFNDGRSYTYKKCCNNRLLSTSEMSYITLLWTNSYCYSPHHAYLCKISTQYYRWLWKPNRNGCSYSCLMRQSSYYL